MDDRALHALLCAIRHSVAEKTKQAIFVSCLHMFEWIDVDLV